MSLITAVCSGGSFICELARKMLELSLFRSRNNMSLNPREAVNEVLLYGAEDEQHMQQIGLNNLLCMFYVIAHASRSVDVCVPSLASEALARCLVKVRENNVKVKVVVHSSDNFDNLPLFAHSGVEVKVINPAVRLEHEFVLMDASGDWSDAVAVVGAIDYDTAGVNCNRDATVLTSDRAVLAALKREFDRVWHSYHDIAFTKLDVDFQ